jgi:hypothetical protein
MAQSLDVEIHFLPDGTVNVVAPQQAGADFESAAPRLAAFAELLSVELGLPVRVEGQPERHVHGPDTHTHTSAHQHV